MYVQLNPLPVPFQQMYRSDQSGVAVDERAPRAWWLSFLFLFLFMSCTLKQLRTARLHHDDRWLPSILFPVFFCYITRKLLPQQSCIGKDSLISDASFSNRRYVIHQRWLWKPRYTDQLSNTFTQCEFPYALWSLKRKKRKPKMMSPCFVVYQPKGTFSHTKRIQVTLRYFQFVV